MTHLCNEECGIFRPCPLCPWPVPQYRRRRRDTTARVLAIIALATIATLAVLGICA